VADTTTAAPSGTFSNFQPMGSFNVDPPAISGTNVAFVAAYNGGTQSGVFRGSGGPLTTIAKAGDLAPQDVFVTFNSPAINGEMVAFQGGYDNVGYQPLHGIFMGNGGIPTAIARQRDRVPVSNFYGFFGDLSSPAFDGSAVGFRTPFIYTGSYEYHGIFEGTGGPLTTVVFTDNRPPAPDTIRPLAPTFSNGKVAYATGNGGVFIRSGGTTTTIAQPGDSTASGLIYNNRFEFMPYVGFNGDTVVFWGFFLDPNNPDPDDNAIFAGSGGPLSVIVKRGDAAPIGTFDGFQWSPSISGDTVAFAGFFDDHQQSGIFTNTNGSLTTVVQTGDLLFGGTVTDLNLGRFGLDPNGSGNLAFSYRLADGREGVALARVISEPLPGDYDGNGVVDASDYVVWRKTLGTTGTGLAADGNGNGEIDTGDYDLWRAHFGESTEAEGIPEPATLTMLGLGVLAVLGCIRRRCLCSMTKPLPASRKHSRSNVCWSVSAIVCSALVFGVAVAPRAVAGTLYAATGGAHGELYILDPATGGVLRDVGPLNDAAGRNYPMEGLAFQPHTRLLYGATHYSDSADPATVSKLVTINPDTAEVTVVGSFYLGNPATMTDLAFYESGGLAGISSYGPPQFFNIDVRTGISMPGDRIGESPTTEGGGIAIRGDVRYVTPTPDELATHFWGWDCFHGECYPRLWYHKISDPDKPAGGGNYGALDFDGDVLYGLNVGPGSPPQTHLVRFNGGQVIDIGRSVDGLAAIAFVPEPGALALSIAGLGGLLVWSRRRGSTLRSRLGARFKFLASLSALCVSLVVAPAAMAVTIDWVTVGDPGNGGNGFGLGDVPYAYRIGKYPVTVNQYVEFLNQKDPTGINTLALYRAEMTDENYGGIRFNAAAAEGDKYEVIAGRGNHPANYITRPGSPIGSTMARARAIPRVVLTHYWVARPRPAIAWTSSGTPVRGCTSRAKTSGPRSDIICPVQRSTFSTRLPPTRRRLAARRPRSSTGQTSSPADQAL
jgi:hypothetical protein